MTRKRMKRMKRMRHWIGGGGKMKMGKMKIGHGSVVGIVELVELGVARHVRRLGPLVR
jgi:hypothetical protein